MAILLTALLKRRWGDDGVGREAEVGKWTEDPSLLG